MCLGLPARIVAVDDAARLLATVEVGEVGGARRQVNIGCIVSEERGPAQCVGDWVLLHLGFAMRRIDEAEALATVALLAELGRAQAEIEAARGAAPAAGRWERGRPG